MKYHFECPQCGYDNKEAGRLFAENEKDCPLCFSDGFHLVRLKRWLVIEADPVHVAALALNGSLGEEQTKEILTQVFVGPSAPKKEKS